MTTTVATTALAPAELDLVLERAAARYRAQLQALCASLPLRALGSRAAEGPALAPGVVLCGELPESGFTQPQWLVQRQDRFLQLPELLYRVLEQLDGRKTLVEVTADVAAATGRSITPERLRQLLEQKLAPAGLVVRAARPVEAPAPPASPGRRSLLMVRARRRLFGPRLIAPVTTVLQALYWPPLLLVLVVAIAAAHGWLYLRHGLDAAGLVRHVASHPGWVAALLGLLVLASLVHEFGHAAALRYGGGAARGIGVGLYLCYPVFFTDVTDAYRLGRWGRLRTDLGGFYFYLLVAVGCIGLYAWTGASWLLVAVLLIDLEVLHQSLPFVRLDGYWAVADLTGVPDLLSQIGPYLRAVIPGRRWPGRRLSSLRGWVKLVFGIYILVTIPALLVMGFLLLRAVPATLATSASAGWSQAQAILAAARAGKPAGAAMGVLRLGILGVTAGGLLLLLGNLGQAGGRLVWRGLHAGLPRRAGAALADELRRWPEWARRAARLLHAGPAQLRRRRVVLPVPGARHPVTGARQPTPQPTRGDGTVPVCRARASRTGRAMRPTARRVSATPGPGSG